MWNEVSHVSREFPNMGNFSPLKMQLTRFWKLSSKLSFTGNAVRISLVWTDSRTWKLGETRLFEQFRGETLGQLTNNFITTPQKTHIITAKTNRERQKFVEFRSMRFQFENWCQNSQIQKRFQSPKDTNCHFRLFDDKLNRKSNENHKKFTRDGKWQHSSLFAQLLVTNRTPPRSWLKFSQEQLKIQIENTSKHVEWLDKTLNNRSLH